MQRSLVTLSVLAAVVFMNVACVNRPAGQIANQHPVMRAYAQNAGDARSPVQPGFGFIYTKQKGPIRGGAQPVSASKSGSAKTHFVSILWYPIIAGWENASVEQAARNGGITKVEYAEWEEFSILGTYGEFGVTVYGQ